MTSRAEQDPYVPALLDPRYDPIDDVTVCCGVCGSAVAIAARRVHADWHEAVRNEQGAALRRLAALADRLIPDAE